MDVQHLGLCAWSQARNDSAQILGVAALPNKYVHVLHAESTVFR